MSRDNTEKKLLNHSSLLRVTKYLVSLILNAAEAMRSGIEI